MNGRKTILLVDDDAGTLRVLSSGLANTLGMFDVATATNGREAVEVLDAQPVDVVVTDLAMPVMDGFALIGHLTNRDATVPVVVLSALAPHDIDVGLNGYHGLTVLTKPAGHEEVASAVLKVLEQVERGQVEGIPLPSVLQLVEAERRTCTLVVTSGRRRGRLHFESGRLINAFSDDFGAEGEAAAHDVLSWERTAIEFDRLPEGIRRLIHLPTQAFLVEVARRQDERTTGLGGHPPLPPRIAADRGPDAGDPGPAPAAVPEGAPPAEAVDRATHDAWATPPDPDGAADASTNPWSDGPAFGAAAPDAIDAPVPDDRPPASAAHEPAAASDDAAPHEAPHPVAHEATHDGWHEATHEAPLQEMGALPEAPVAGPEAPVAGPEASDAGPEASDAAAPEATEAAPDGAGPNPTAEAPESVRDLIAAIARLTDRVHAADEALAAVATEVAAFHEAQRRYDAAVAQREAQREERRRRTAAVRDDVAALAREILAKMDGLFDALTEGEAADAPPVERSERPTARP